MKDFTELTIIFANKDELKLTLTLQHFAKFKPTVLFTLMYGEYHPNSDFGEGSHVFMATGTEYFPESAKDVAIGAFFARMRSNNPHIEYGAGFCLEDILEKHEV